MVTTPAFTIPLKNSQCLPSALLQCGRTPFISRPSLGRPPDEPSTLGEALNDVFVPLFTKQFPEVVDFWLPPEACSYRIAVVSIKKSYPGHARRIMLAVWSYLKQFTYTKFVIVVDDDIDARNWQDVVGSGNAYRPIERHSNFRKYANRLFGFCLPLLRTWIQNGYRCHYQDSSRNATRVG